MRTFGQRLICFEEATGTDPKPGTGPSNTEPKDNKLVINGKEVDPGVAASALSLYNALADESTGREIVEALARRAGLLNEDGGIKGKNKEQVGEKLEGKAHKLLKSKLGKDYEKFADIVGPVFDEAIEEYLDERFGENEQRQTSTSWESSIDKFMESHSLTKDIEGKMQELMEDAPPNISKKGFDTQKYLRRMYNNAIEELGIENPTAKRGRDDVPTFTVKKRPQGASLDDAIEAAMKGIRFE